MPPPDRYPDFERWRYDLEAARKIADNTSMHDIRARELSLTAARNADAENIEIWDCGFARHLRVAPVENAGDMLVSIDPGCTVQTLKNAQYLSPGSVINFPFKQVAIANPAQDGKTARIEVSPNVRLGEQFDAKALLTGEGVRVSIDDRDPAPVIRGWLDKYLRTAPAGALVVDRYNTTPGYSNIPPNNFHNIDVTVSPPVRNIAVGNVRVVCGGIASLAYDAADNERLASLGAKIRAIVYEVDAPANTYQTPVPIESVSALNAGFNQTDEHAGHPDPQMHFVVAPFVLRRPLNTSRPVGFRLTINGAMWNSIIQQRSVAPLVSYCFDTIDVPVADSPFGG